MSTESNNTSEQFLEPVYSSMHKNNKMLIEDPRKLNYQQEELTKVFPLKLTTSVSEFRLQQLPPLQTMITKFANRNLAAAKKVIQQKVVNINNCL